MRVLLGFAAYAAAVGFYLTPARGQDIPLCAPHDVMAKILADRFGQERDSVSTGGPLHVQVVGVFETWTNHTERTRTFTVTGPGEPTCIIGMTHDLETVKPVWGEPT